jgi:hypothetical protein
MLHPLNLKKAGKNQSSQLEIFKRIGNNPVVIRIKGPAGDVRNTRWFRMLLEDNGRGKCPRTNKRGDIAH